MISAKADIAFTPEGSIRVAHNLMKKGAHIYLYNGGFHHSKIMMIDSTFCTVGTANLDSRSLRYDYEVNAFIFDKEITEELSEIFEKDKQNCTMLTPEEWRKRSVWKRFVGMTWLKCALHSYKLCLTPAITYTEIRNQPIFTRSSFVTHKFALI